MTGYAVAAGHQLTADAAAAILDDGGTAVDAAIAAALTAMVAEPVLAGFFGGGFLMVRSPNGASQLLDFFVQTPRSKVGAGDLDFRSIEAEFGTTTQEFHIGAGAIATPGVPSGLAEAHARFGRVPMRQLVEPACEAARKGVTITEYQATLSQIVSAILTAAPEVRALFCEDDLPRREGSVSRNPDLADVIETFAIEGARFATEGEAAQAVLSVADRGGHLAADDLRRYQPRWREPLHIERGEARLALNPPPSLGGALIAFPLALLGRAPGIAEVLQALSATTRARIDAALDADPSSGARRLLSDGMLKRYARDIAGHSPATRGTTHISVIDRSGMGAALTLSNGEGCGLIAPGTGTMPNNMLGEADLLPNGFESWTPDTRMSSMMCPLAVDWPDGRFAMLGSGGSNRIRSALAQVLVHLIDGGLQLSDAIEAARVHVEAGDPEGVDFEDLGGEARREAVLRAFPDARPWPDLSMFFGGVHAAMSSPRGGVAAAGDPRRAGVSVTG